MPALRNRLVVEVARGLKAFLHLDIGLTRGQGPLPELTNNQDRQLQHIQRRPEGSKKVTGLLEPLNGPASQSVL